MILRGSPPELFAILLRVYAVLNVVAAVAAADEPFNCRPTIGSFKYDLTSLGGQHSVARERSQPPSTWVDTVTFDLCDKLKKQDDVPEVDQCPDGTQVCLTKTNKKSGEADRITSVIPIAQVSSLNPQLATLDSPTKGILVQLHGPEYPHPTNTTPAAQIFKLTVLCDPDRTGEPKFISYNSSELVLEWSASAGCGFQDDENKGGDKGGDDKKDDDNAGGGEPESVGSGVGWFFLVLLLAFIAYFALGAYYNYSTYGATGADLIPHRDFWREVPYMLSDVFSHLCSTVRPRRTASRGGYISV
ncbi:hypothetical protein HGRIS_002121 [Hohenbuehelia grisea]|uniref:Autophagy-related protein 27 n=1 Tax=Hohenbuehelia grisea TaxID=104357 RepID=A0ABR3JKL6_9AGAR